MPLPPRSDLPGHDVTNQPPERGDVDLWTSDPALVEGVAAQAGPSAGWAGDLAAQGRTLGQAIWREAGRTANRRLPDLRQFDAGGRRLDEVQFDAAYHAMMACGVAAGYAAAAWEGRPGGHVAHAALVYLHSQVEPGTCCPMTMTHAAIPALAADPALAEIWRPRLTARHYDPSVAPVAAKESATMGMAMTEKQGGSDLRATATTARRSGGEWRLNGHKWFCSAPMSDGFLTLAQAPGGLSCYLVPRWLDARRNGIHLMRLKDKLGNRANASAEIEYHDAVAYPLGEEGAGIRTILAMVHQTRLDTAMAPAGLMRAALAEAIHWARHRVAFQRRLVDQPLMEAVLADLALDREGALALALRVARAFGGDGEADRGLARIGVALAKFLSNKLAPVVIVEAMEALGGMGYVEDTMLPMLYREAPLNGIWEGSGNVIALDILRTLDRDAAARDSLEAELAEVRGWHPAYDRALASLPRDRVPEGAARQHAERLATLLTAAVLARTVPPEIAVAYAESRLSPRSRIYGTVADLPTERILSRF
jgi:putative acyl-CoA dehydrogenase